MRVVLQSPNHQITKSPILYYITDSSQLPPGVTLREKIEAAFAAGVDRVQIRERRLSTRELLRLASEAVALRGPGKLLVNDRLDVALASGADGVHLPAGRPAASEIRMLGGDGFLVGVSCHSVEEVERAAGEGADFVVLGPIFATPGKGPPLGLKPLERAARAPVPVLALGGVALANARQCLEAGAAGIAGIRIFQDAENLAETVARLKNL